MKLTENDVNLIHLCMVAVVMMAAGYVLGSAHAGATDSRPAPPPVVTSAATPPPVDLYQLRIASERAHDLAWGR